MRPEIERLVRELDLDDCVVLTGSRSDVPDLLRAIDVFVLSSYTVECFPIALLEAMAAGRPAVCTAVGGVPEMIEEPDDGLPRASARSRCSRRSAGTYPVRFRARTSDGPSSACACRNLVQPACKRFGDRARTGRAGIVRAKAQDRPVRLTVVLDLTSVGGAESSAAQSVQTLRPAKSLCRGWCACAKPARSPTSSGRQASMSRFSAGPADSTCEPCLALSVLFAAARTDAVLVTHHHRASLALGRIAARLARVPVNIVAAHDMDLTSVGQRVLPRWAVNTLAFSDALVLLSPGQGRYLHREEGVGQRLRGTTREVVIPNGIQLPASPTTADRLRARTIVGCHRIRFRRGDRRPAECTEST